ncbi:exosortase [Desulfomarina profundi]|uniref:Exosortase n=1 Tax=Desulfomarina profundi TaxID=2772557 RepID=A0A8D5JFZ2_9BACT|nr:exosortase [Desulfomarina profundi]BCL59419.1 exosortase [Desulfomarina profundi]
MIVRQPVWSGRNIFSAGILLVALFILYWPFLIKLVADWGTNDDYSHGYFIPALTLYFIYHIRDKLRDLTIRPSFFGLFVIVAGLVQLVIGKIGSEFFLQRTSLIIVLYGLVLFFLGWAYLRKLFLPLSYLFFMVPLPAIIWNKIAFPMQLFASALTEKVVYALGIAIYREGNVLHLAETTLEVVAACSGLRSLMTMFALSAALAFLSSLSRWKKIILLLSAAPIAVIANILRLSGTAVLASRYGSEVAQGFLHEFSGIVVFMLGLGMLVAVNTLLSKIGRKI